MNFSRIFEIYDKRNTVESIFLTILLIIICSNTMVYVFQELQSRFEDFKQSVKTGSERFVHCEAAANALLRRSPPFARDILKRQEKLR